MNRYKSLIDNVLTESIGSFSDNNYVELQVRMQGNGYFNVIHTDGFRIFWEKHNLRINQIKSVIRNFRSTK